MPDIRSLYEKEFLGQWDVADQDLIYTIDGAMKEGVMDPQTHKPKNKVCLAFKETDKKMVLNATNREIVAKLMSTYDYTKWIGKRIQLYKDPKVRFGRDEVGGLRILRRVRQQDRAGVWHDACTDRGYYQEEVRPGAVPGVRTEAEGGGCK